MKFNAYGYSSTAPSPCSLTDMPNEWVYRFDLDYKGGEKLVIMYLEEPEPKELRDFTFYFQVIEPAKRPGLTSMSRTDADGTKHRIPIHRPRARRR